MPLSFYNTLTRKSEPFEPITSNEVKMYTCGPTVYDFPHIGNFRAYAFEDLLRRFLKFKGFKVTQVMNITDVDDKIIKRSQEEKTNTKEIAEKFTRAFFEDLKELNIEPAEFYPRATEHIPEMISLIKKLLDVGFAYKTDDGSTYFSISKFSDYGRLSHLDISELKPGARVKQDEYSKEKACDFALWKAYDSSDGEVFWETELGKGRPGWHIECSAMSMKYLGENFDIHTGGVDNIFPHHENEIAQSQAITSKKFVNYWLHCEHLLVDNKKMSKSLGNYYTLRDLIKRGYLPLALRYFYISSHYRSKLNFTLEALKSCQNTLEGLYNFITRLKNVNLTGQLQPEIVNLIKETRKKFEEFLDEDLNSPRAIAAIFDMIKAINQSLNENKLTQDSARAVIGILICFDQVLGLNLAKILEPEELSEEIKKLIKERELARKNKDWKQADKIRITLREKGIILEDRKDLPPRVIMRKKDG